MKKLFLLDAYALIYRAHFAFIKRPLINSKGLNVSAISGFANTVWEILNKEKPTHLAVAFDLPALTFRHEIFEEYKANRDEQPEDITLSIPIIKKMLEGFRIPILEKAGYEADDIIGTVAKKAEQEGFQVYMMTPDKDYAQLVSDNIFLYKPKRSGNAVEVYGVEEVKENWGVSSPEQIIDLLGLQGDSVDNIPGIRGVGPKTAKKLLAKYHTVEGVLENVDKLTGKVKEHVGNGRENALLSKVLATIKLDVDIPFDEKALEVSEFDDEALLELFKELEFRTLTSRILQKNQPKEEQQTDLFGNVVETEQKTTKAAKKIAIVEKNIENTEHQYFAVKTAEERQTLIQKLAAQTEICLDTETTGLNTQIAEIVGMSFAFKKGEAYYVPFPDKREDAQQVMEEFRTVLENENIAKIGQNLKYDCLIFRNYDIHIKGKLFDTMLMHYLIEPEKRHNMTYLSETYLNYSPIPIEQLIGKKGKRQLSMRDIAVDKVVDYAAEDADITLQLKEVLVPLMEDGIKALYETMEAPLVEVLVEMETNGVYIDADFLAAYSKELDEEIETFKAKIYELAGTNNFNLDSPRQVGEVLFERLKLPYRWKKTKTKQYSTDESKLSSLADDHEIVAHILQYRQLAKLKSTYVEALPLLVSKKTGRIHSSFNQALTATGRLSSQNPNLQNIPIRTARGREIRKAFVPQDEEHILLAADYSQIELRLMAEIAGDKAMLEAFRQGQDIHKATAARIYDVTLEEVTKEQRYNAKTVNFSIIYGAGATNLSKNLGIKRSEAQALIDQYFEQHEGIKNYMESAVNEAREAGYVTTLCGRRRYLHGLKSRNSMMRSHAERNAINTPIQGTAADMIKLAMIKIHKLLQEGNYATKMILQVHDELVFEVPKTELETIKPLIEEAMRTALPSLQVPIVVEAGIGNNWLEAH